MSRFRVIANGLGAVVLLLPIAYLLYGAFPGTVLVGTLGVVALFGIFAWREWRRPRPGAGAAPVAEAPRSLLATLINCGVILAIDVALLGAPMLGAYVTLALILWLLPRTLLAWRKPALRRHRARVALVAAGALALDIGAWGMLETIAERRVIAVADAISRYKAREGAYPQNLLGLVPQDLPEVPEAKPGIMMFGNIVYLHRASPPGVMYYSFPPLGRKVLNVETREWSYID